MKNISKDWSWISCFLLFCLTLTVAAEGEEEKLPLEPTRELTLELEEGTWISLDVSPDGSTLVFELLGDLYSMPIEGGAATAITRGMAYDSQPKYSPDGKWIAFISDRDGAENLWVMEADGSHPRRLSSEKGLSEFASPCWSVSGDYVFVSKAPEGVWVFGIWMYHLEGGAGVQVTKIKPKPDAPRSQRVNSLGVSADPAGRFIYFARKTGGFEYNMSFPAWQIARRDLTTGDEDILTQSPGSAFRPLISPDGALLVYGSRHETETELRVRHLDTGEDRRLIFPVQRDDQESRFTRDLLPGYAFLPDSSHLVTFFEGKIRKVALATGESSIIPFRADVNLPLGRFLHYPYRLEDGPQVTARLIQGPVPDPEGTRWVFSALTRLYRLEGRESSPTELFQREGAFFHPSWSPDGEWLAFVGWDGEEGHLWKAPADGSSEPIQMSEVPAFYSDPVWSPDGNWILALRGSRYMRRTDFDEFSGVDIPLDLIKMDAQSGEMELIAPSRGLGQPHFGPSEERVFLYTRDLLPSKEGAVLVSMRLDGTDRREHIRVTGKGLYSHDETVGADDIRISPDGKWVLAAVQNQLFLVALPRPGGEAPEVNVAKPSVPMRRVSSVGADYFGWSREGQEIFWAIGDTVFQLAVEDILFRTPEETSDESDGAGDWKDPAGVTQFRIAVTRPRAKPEGQIALIGARLITMRGEEVIERGTVLVDGNRISAVGPVDEVSVPAAARKIDLAGKTIVPGFVDTHAHWFEIRKGVLDLQNWSFLANLAYGVTTGLDVQTMTNDMFAYQDLVETGQILGPRALSTGPGIFSNNDFQSLEQARDVVRRYRDYYHTRNLKAYISGNRKQRHYLAQAAHELEMMPTTEGALDLKLDLTHAVDGFTGNEHALPIVPLFADVVELYAQSKIGYTPTLLVNYGGPFAENYFYTNTEVHDRTKLSRFIPHEQIDAKTRRVDWFREDEYIFDETAAQALKIFRAGGRVGVGSHGQLQGLGYHWELWALASGGFTPLEALRCATIDGAKIVGVAADVGSLESGKMADLVILDRNPLEDIHHTESIDRVMKNGELFEGDTLKKVWPEEEEPGPFWWWEDSTGEN